MPHYVKGREVNPDYERELRAWAFAHEEPPAPEAAEFAPISRVDEGRSLLPDIEEEDWREDRRPRSRPGDSLHNIHDDPCAWQGTASEDPPDE